MSRFFLFDVQLNFLALLYSYLRALVNYLIILKISIMKHFVSFLCMCSIGFISYASPNIIYQKTIDISKIIPQEIISNQFIKPVVHFFVFECPSGSHGEGYFIYIVKDDKTGEVIDSGSFGAGCTSDEPINP